MFLEKIIHLFKRKKKPKRDRICAGCTCKCEEWDCIKPYTKGSRWQKPTSPKSQYRKFKKNGWSSWYSRRWSKTKRYY